MTAIAARPRCCRGERGNGYRRDAFDEVLEATSCFLPFWMGAGKANDRVTDADA